MTATPYFERQVGAWCGMHALNNYLGGPYVAQSACKLAANRVVAILTGAGLRDAESLDDAKELRAHIDPLTGFLSVQVIIVLGSSTIGLHVEEASTSREHLQTERGAAALVSWNNQHWTVLQAVPGDRAWVHSNSICGNGPHRDRVKCSTVDHVASILAQIELERGACTLHRIIRGADEAGASFLASEGRRAMIGPEDTAIEDGAGGAGSAHAARTVRVVTMNVAGVSALPSPPRRRMNDILTKLLTEVEPDVLCFQEVDDDMFGILQMRTRPVGDMHD